MRDRDEHVRAAVGDMTSPRRMVISQSTVSGLLVELVEVTPDCKHLFYSVVSNDVIRHVTY